MKKQLLLLLAVCGLCATAQGHFVDDSWQIEGYGGANLFIELDGGFEFYGGVIDLELPEAILGGPHIPNPMDLITLLRRTAENKRNQKIRVICAHNLTDDDALLIARFLGDKLIGFHVHGRLSTRFSGTGLSYLAYYCPNIKELVCTGFVSDCVTHIYIVRMQNLEILHLSIFPRLDVEALLNGLRWMRLRDLKIFQGGWVAGEQRRAVDYSALRSFPCLEKVAFDFINFNPGWFPESLKDLEWIKLRRIDGNLERLSRLRKMSLKGLYFDDYVDAEYFFQPFQSLHCHFLIELS